MEGQKNSMISQGKVYVIASCLYL